MSFDHVAGVYDFLARLVFGNALRNASASFLSEIPANPSVLLIGGGTGKILNDLDIQGKMMQIDYLDASEKMIQHARTHGPFLNLKITFIHADILEWKRFGKYDIVITPFLLDCLTTAQIRELADQIDVALVPDGKWLFTDFVQTDSFWQTQFIRFMYLFFRITASLKNKMLPDYDSALKEASFHTIRRKSFCKGMIESRVYVRNSSPKDS